MWGLSEANRETRIHGQDGEVRWGGADPQERAHHPSSCPSGHLEPDSSAETGGRGKRSPGSRVQGCSCHTGGQVNSIQHQEKLKQRNAKLATGHGAIAQRQGSELDTYRSCLTETSKSLAHSASPLPNRLRPLLLVLWKPRTKHPHTSF